MDIEEVRQELVELYKRIEGRPTIGTHWHLGGPAAWRGARAAWDAANPEAAALVPRIDELVQLEERMREEASRSAAEASAAAAAAKVLADVPRVLATVLAGPAETESTGAVAEFDANKALWCLLLMGGVGCGKSTAVGAMVYAAAASAQRNPPLRGDERRHMMPVWVRAVEASRLSGFGEDTEARLRGWRRARLLVVDDLGTELMTPTWQQALEDVLDYRYQHSLRTVLPTNLTAAEFKARYGARIVDRIRQDGMVRELSAASMRTKR